MFVKLGTPGIDISCIAMGWHDSLIRFLMRERRGNVQKFSCGCPVDAGLYFSVTILAHVGELIMPETEQHIVKFKNLDVFR